MRGSRSEHVVISRNTLDITATPISSERWSTERSAGSRLGAPTRLRALGPPSDNAALFVIVGAFCDRYPNPNTNDHYRRLLNDLFRTSNRRHPRDLTEQDLIDWCSGAGRRIANNSVRSRIALARTFLGWCLRNDHVADNPMVDAAGPDGPLIHPRSPRGRATTRSMLQRGDPGYEHNEGRDERQELVKPVQVVEIQQLVEDDGEKEADNRKCESPPDPSRREFVSALEHVADSNRDQSGAPYKTGRTLNRPWRMRRCRQIGKQQPSYTEEDDRRTQDPLGPVNARANMDARDFPTRARLHSFLGRPGPIRRTLCPS